MSTLFHKFIAGLSALIMAIVPVSQPVQPVAPLGAAPQFVSAKPTYLYGSGISSSDTSIKLTSLVTPTGDPIITNQLIGGVSNVFYGTLEPNTTRKETVSCTTVTQNSDNTAILSGCTRGLLFTYPYTASSSLAFSHSGGSRFVLSNSPQLYQDIIDYVNNATSSGAVDASLTAKGIVEVATGTEAASNKAIGSGNTSAPLALTTAISTSTAPSSGNYVVVTKSTGKIDNAFLDSTATATLATSTIIGAYPAWQIGKNMYVASSTGTSTWSVPNGITKVYVRLVGGGGNGGAATCNNVATTYSGGSGGGGGYAEKMANLTGSSTVTIFVGSAAQESSFGYGSSFFFKALGGSSGSGGTGGAGGSGVGGDINITGQGGGAGVGAVSQPNSSSGGSSVLGGGGKGVIGSDGSAGANYGGGASGNACLASNSSQFTGGAGAQGVVIINW